MQPNDMQNITLDLIETTKSNLFITGAGGVGKSVLVDWIKFRLSGEVILLAPTGTAALAIKGATVHKTFGLRGEMCGHDRWEAVDSRTRNLFHGDTVTTIIIDEISMLRSDVFITIDKMLRSIKDVDKPFGGLRIILVGDFHQLPPVVVESEQKVFNKLYPCGKFAYTTKTWRDLDLVNINLTEVMRQKDAKTREMLNCIRQGGPSLTQMLDAVDYINETAPETSETASLTLCTTKKMAERINDRRYDALDGYPYSYRGITTGKFSKKDYPVPEKLELKLGCRVIICANSERGGYYNGQMGEVVEVLSRTDDSTGNEIRYVRVEVDSGDTVDVCAFEWESLSYALSPEGKLEIVVDGIYTQMAVKLGYAITIHKAQGMTLDEHYLKLGSGTWESGQAYVGMSRIRDLKNLILPDEICLGDIIVDKDVVEFYKGVKWHE